jgi:hypothetical protein
VPRFLAQRRTDAARRSHSVSTLHILACQLPVRSAEALAGPSAISDKQAALRHSNNSSLRPMRRASVTFVEEAGQLFAQALIPF